MRSFLAFTVGIAALSGGCFDYSYSRRHDHGDSYQYCDQSGCFECNDDGCTQVSGAGAGGSTPDAGRPNNSCACPAGFTCDSGGSCVPQPCAQNDDCEQGCYCEQDKCVETRRCRRNEDCRPSETCDTARSTCMPATTTPRPDAGPPRPDAGLPQPDAGLPQPDAPPPAPTPQCQTDANCAPNEACCNGECKPARVYDPQLICTSDGQCGGGDCAYNLCQAKCTTELDCGTGDVCISGFCGKNPNPPSYCIFNSQCGSGSDATCINGTCHANCETDDQCFNLADFCDQGICQPDWRRVSECTLDRDCTVAGQQCVNGDCRTRCMQNADCDNCPDGPTCSMGYCQQ